MEQESLEGWQLLKVKGIPLIIHPSWLVILLLFTWSAQGQINAVTEASVPLWFSWCLGLVTAIMLFLSVLLHELGHSFMALHEGVKVRSITLFLLGGVARVEKECATPMGTLRVALAGPLVSIFLALICFQSIQKAEQLSPFLSNLLTQLGSLNLVLGLFNLLPGLPLDGGVILKSLVWKFTGSYRKGVEAATATGRFLSVLAIVLGILVSIKGGLISGLWLIVLGWFGLSASRSQSQMLALQQALKNLRVEKAAGRSFRVFEEDQPVRRLSEIQAPSPDGKQIPDWVLICNSGRWVGYVAEKLLKDLPVQSWDKYCMGDYLKPLNDLPAISYKAPLWEAVLALEKSKEGRLLVFNIAGLPCGTLEKVDLGIAVLKELGINLPANFIDPARKLNSYPLGMNLLRIVETMHSSGIIDTSN